MRSTGEKRGETSRRALGLVLALAWLASDAFAQHGYSGGGFSGGYRGGSSGGSYSRGSGGSSYGADLPDWAFRLLFLSPFVFFLGLIVLIVRQQNIVGSLVIVTPPPGEAPDEIRAAWVGVALPLRRSQRRVVTLPAMGIRSGKSVGRVTGFAVSGADAIAALERTAPDAAAWWRKNAAHSTRANYFHVFPSETCEAFDDIGARFRGETPPGSTGSEPSPPGDI